MILFQHQPIQTFSQTLPILEGVGGAVAGVGVRTDPHASNLVLALPLVGNAYDVSSRINGGVTASTITNSGVDFVTTISNFYGRIVTGKQDY